MKSKFSSLDVSCVVKELQNVVQGLRVINVYDINNKSYIIKMGQEEKKMLYIESGCRIHITEFDWPKQLMPSVFSAKCRKVMKNKRLTSINQVGCDRIVDLQFGSGEFSSHLIIELYDKGNICLCNDQYVITSILRTRQDEKEDIRYAISHFYPFDVCQQLVEPSIKSLEENSIDIKPGTQLKRWLNFQFPFSLPLLEHCLKSENLLPDLKISTEYVRENIQSILQSVTVAYNKFTSIPNSSHMKGFIILKAMKNDISNLVMDEFHPFLFTQLENKPTKEFELFNIAIDHFFYEQSTQKIEVKSAQQEKSMLKKLENIRKDHEKRITDLQNLQEESKQKGYLVEVNIDMVDEAIDIIQNAIANRLTWDEINELIEEGKENGHTTALAIKSTNLEKNMITLMLSDPYDDSETPTLTPVILDLDLGAYGNAKKYYDEVKTSAVKEQKTIQSSSVALKNAEKKTKAVINDLNVVTLIKKARKMMWFEKFLWFISSERFIVIGGRDAQQNEILVRRYLKKNDVYVHADTHGATSIIIKNKSAEPIPPRTLMEAGCFALCHSSAWDNKIVTSAYWVHAHQVSKTAPSGEYLTTGSFMIRGKKNYLPPSQHVLGFSVLFRVDEESVERRKENRGCSLGGHMTSAEIDVGQMEDEEEDGAEINVNEDEIEEGKEGGEEDIGDLFDKYNLQISAVVTSTSSPRPINTEYTEFIGTAHRPHYKKQQNVPNQQSKQGKLDTNQDTKKSTQPKRGQRGKNKKRQKYADQSDDEREAAMSLLGSIPNKPKQEKVKHNNSKQKYKPQSTAKNVASSTNTPNPNKLVQPAMHRSSGTTIFSSQSVTDSPATEVTSNPAQEHNSSGAAKADPLATTTTGAITMKAEEEDDDDNSDTEKDSPMDFLDSLILDPSPEDAIVFGIPFVAPYTVMTSCKYRCKLTPGTTKKGRACKTILDMFGRDKNASLQEKNVFKSLKDVDMTVNIPGKVKISAPNLHAGKRK